MRTVIGLVLLLISLKGNAQCPIDPKKVKGVDAAFYGKDSFYYYWNVGNLPEIIESPYPIEVRLYAHGLFDGTCFVILSDGNKWKGKVSTYDTSYRTIMVDVSDSIDVKKIFVELTHNRIFELPDESKLNFEKTVRDGMHFQVEYKICGVYRRYKFSNPKVYRKYYPALKELTHYVNISDLFLSMDKWY